MATSTNPAQDKVTVRFLQARSLAARYELVEVATGRVLVTQSVTGTDALTLNVATLPPGVYAGRLLNATGGVLGTGKVVVIH